MNLFPLRTRGSGPKPNAREQAEGMLVMLTVVVCPCLLLGGVSEGWHSWRLAQAGARVTGTIRDIDSNTKRVRLQLVLDDPDQSEVEVRGSQLFAWWSLTGHRIGQQVPVYWLPGNRSSARLCRVEAVTIAAVLALLLTGVLLWRHFRKPREFAMGEW